MNPESGTQQPKPASEKIFTGRHTTVPATRAATACDGLLVKGLKREFGHAAGGLTKLHIEYYARMARPGSAGSIHSPGHYPDHSLEVVNTRGGCTSAAIG